MTTADSLRGHARWRWWELALFAALPLVWWLLPAQSLLLNEIAITALFAVSLDPCLLGRQSLSGGKIRPASVPKSWVPL